MSEEFLDWLAQCPVQWYRDNEDENSSTYTFINNTL